MRYYAVGDIHGYLDQLAAAHDRIARDRAETGDSNAPVVHLGDLVDRGPDSRGVLEFLIDGIAAGAPWIVLKGNHDAIFQGQIDRDADPAASFAGWCSDTMGGAATVLSYGVEPSKWRTGSRNREKLIAATPPEHLAFLRALPLYHETPDLLFVHAGIRPGLALSEQLEDDLLWIRRDFLDDARDHGRLVVHGHTPVEAPMHCGNRINLDTGAGYGRQLTAAVFEGRDCFILEEDGRRRIAPPDDGGL